LLSNVRRQVLSKLIKPYTNIKLSFIANELNIDEHEVEQFIVVCILDKLVFMIITFDLFDIILFYFSVIDGHIDQKNKILILKQEEPTEINYAAIEEWTNELITINVSILKKIIENDNYF